jgi:hypothetical protein
MVSFVPKWMELHRRHLAGSKDDLEQQPFRVVLGKEPTRGEDEVRVGEHINRHIEFGDSGGDQSSAVRLDQIAVDRPKFGGGPRMRREVPECEVAGQTTREAASP